MQRRQMSSVTQIPLEN